VKALAKNRNEGINSDELGKNSQLPALRRWEHRSLEYRENNYVTFGYLQNSLFSQLFKQKKWKYPPLSND
jgi:hypothetical protein